MKNFNNNIMIAEFMGSKLHESSSAIIWGIDTPKNGSNVRDTALLEYETSWDWLMPVVEKIEEYHTPNFYSFGKSNENDYCVSFDINSYVIICTLHFKQPDPTKQRKTEQFSTNVGKLKLSKIECIYTTVIKFINWYNENRS